jgi:hypothetical protein
MGRSARSAPLRRAAEALTALGLFLGIDAAAHAEGLPVALVSITARVAPGGMVALVIRTEPGSVCSGQRQGHASDAFSVPLPPHRTGADGEARWQWSVLSGNRPIGVRRVHVSCARSDRSGSLETEFDVR